LGEYATEHAALYAAYKRLEELEEMQASSRSGDRSLTEYKTEYTLKLQMEN